MGKACDDALLDWIGNEYEYDRCRQISLLKPANSRGCQRDSYIWFLLDNLGDEHLETIRIAFTTEQFDVGRSIAALVQRIKEPINRRTIGKSAVQNDNVALIRRVQGKRPRDRAAQQRDELATADHSITSSASARSLSGIWRPSVLAVLRLMTSSNLVGTCTGRSAGFSPLRTRSIYPAARRNCSLRTSP